MDWRAAVAAENQRLGIKDTPARPSRSHPDAATQIAATSWKPPQSGRGAHQAGMMNKLETRYAQQLELRRMAGEIRKWSFEPMKLKLADRTYLTIDFNVILPDGAIELHEVKGHWEDDARVKVKMAARLFDEYQIVGVSRPKGLGDWKFEYFKRGGNSQ